MKIDEYFERYPGLKPREKSVVAEDMAVEMEIERERERRREGLRHE